MRVKLGMLRRLIREEIDMSDVSGEQMAGRQVANLRARADAASDPDTPPSMLVALARDQRREVRHNVGANPNTPLATLLELAEDEDVIVKYAVSMNPNTPLKIAQGLKRWLGLGNE